MGEINTMYDYLVIYEQGETGWSAYVPDLPVVVAAGDTREEVEELMQGAIEMHLEAMLRDGVSIPQPSTYAGRVAVSDEALAVSA